MRIIDLLDRNSVCLNASPVSKEAAISQLVDIISQSGCINDPNRFKEAVFDRERKSSTGLGEGIAIPHAKSQGVTRPGLASMVVPHGVDFDSFDGEPAHLLFLIASPHQASDAHLDVLARLSTLLIDESFRKSLLSAKTVDEYLEAIDRAERVVEEKEAQEAWEQAEAEEAEKKLQQEEQQESEGDSEHEEHHEHPKGKKKSYDIVAVTACPAGLSHTYMAAEALEQKAKELGISIKVEADGAAGNRNSLLPSEIAAAKAVIVAADRAIDMDRFVGKRMVRTGVVDGVRKPELLIQKALASNCPVYKAGSMTESSSLLMKLYRHLMSGLTYILPLAATAGILAAVARLEFVQVTSLGLFLDTISYSIGTLLFPVLSAFIAFSMAGRMALVAGFTGGVMADMANAGVVGALLNGFVGGGVAFLMARGAQRFLKGHDAMFALLVYPLVGAVVTTLIAQFITNIPANLIDRSINDYIGAASTLELVILGAVLAGMMAADMGGPFNKIAYASGVMLLADCLPENGSGSMVMGSVMLGGMVPPIAAGIASRLISPHRFSQKERASSLLAIFKGLLFITEAVLPYLMAAKRLRIACIVGSAIAGGISMFFRCGVVAPHGGIFIIPLAINPLFYIAALAGGSLVGALLFSLLRPVDQQAFAEYKEQKRLNKEQKALKKAAQKEEQREEQKAAQKEEQKAATQEQAELEPSDSIEPNEPRELREPLEPKESIDSIEKMEGKSDLVLSESSEANAKLDQTKDEHSAPAGKDSQPSPAAISC